MIDPRLGGPQHRSLLVAKEVRKHGIETEFLIPGGDNSFKNKAEAAGFCVHRSQKRRLQPPSQILSNIQYATRFPQAVYTIAAIIKNRNIDVVHANMPLNFEAAFATSLTDARLIWHFNDIALSWPLTTVTSRVATNLADEIVVASQSVGEHYFSNSKRDYSTLYAPVDTNKFDPEKIEGGGLREELGITSETALIGAVGNINPLKDYRTLLQSISRFRDRRDQEIAVAIAGEPIDSREDYYNDLLDLRSDLGLDEIVTFIGYRSDVAEVLFDLDVFVLSSVSEACPMVVLEAMATETPVVATSVGGVPEQIRDNSEGLLVPPENPEAMAKAFYKILSNEGMSKKMAERSRERVIEKFSLKRCVSRHRDIYQKTAGET